ncbi:MAG: gliding motility-associated C-terminal domain-containing protein, partial [Chitinophagaceae bacterium]|nr:gliding motility-associated C-terminal domain-containing protein [Chitinophagaceae bacterium]
NCCGTLAMPNAFSPNGDNTNDVFRPVGNARFEQYDFSVYNRWGQRVFQTNSLNTGWNGEINGKQADLGTYHFLLRYRCFGDGSTRVIKGDLLLIR